MIDTLMLLLDALGSLGRSLARLPATILRLAQRLATAGPRLRRTATQIADRIRRTLGAHLSLRRVHAAAALALSLAALLCMPLALLALGMAVASILAGPSRDRDPIPRRLGAGALVVAGLTSGWLSLLTVTLWWASVA